MCPPLRRGAFCRIGIGFTDRWQPWCPLKRASAGRRFSFPCFWTLWHRLWLVALGLVAANLVISVLIFQIGTNEVVAIVVSCSIALMLGFMGNDFRRSKLEKQGFIERGHVIDRTAEAAMRQYLEIRMGNK